MHICFDWKTAHDLEQWPFLPGPGINQPKLSKPNATIKGEDQT